MNKHHYWVIALGGAALLAGCEAYVHTDAPPSKVEVQTSPPPAVDVEVKPARPRVDVDVDTRPGGGVDVDVKRNP